MLPAQVERPAVAEPVTSRADKIAFAVAVALVLAAVAVGVALNWSGRTVWAAAPPAYATWLPHVGPGTPFALLIAAATVWYGPMIAARIRWLPLLATGYVTALAWTLALAMVDGWRRGLAERLTTEHEYLHEVPAITDIPTMLRGFTARILDFQPDSWTTHVSGHPPGATLVFVLLDRVGLGGGGAAALTCVVVGSLAAVAVPVTVSRLDGEQRARAVLPFVVIFPGAVWVGASADGLFLGVTSVGLALLAAAASTRGISTVALGLGAGILLGFGCFLSYGLVLIAVLALAVVLLARRADVVGWALLAVAAVVAVFAAAGFWWLDGFHLVVARYYQGVAAERSYAYWVWANLASLVLSAGPAAAVIISRATAAAVGGRARILRLPATVLLPIAAAATIALADLSGLSKAEVERIWLPFAIWLLAGAALLPPRSRRGWLAVQAVTALAVNHLLLTVW